MIYCNKSCVKPDCYHFIMINLGADLRSDTDMDNITTGHWIFAGIFMLAFIVYLIWSYRKDAGTHAKYYGKGSRVLLGLVVIIFVLFILKQLLQSI
jgi:heme/copper-type cytochrome/quinol oxidase subunit 2